MRDAMLDELYKRWHNSNQRLKELSCPIPAGTEDENLRRRGIESEKCQLLNELIDMRTDHVRTGK